MKKVLEVIIVLTVLVVFYAAIALMHLAIAYYAFGIRSIHIDDIALFMVAEGGVCFVIVMLWYMDSDNWGPREGKERRSSD